MFFEFSAPWKTFPFDGTEGANFVMCKLRFNTIFRHFRDKILSPLLTKQYGRYTKKYFFTVLFALEVLRMQINILPYFDLEMFQVAMKSVRER